MKEWNLITQISCKIWKFYTARRHMFIYRTSKNVGNIDFKFWCAYDVEKQQRQIERFVVKLYFFFFSTTYILECVRNCLQSQDVLYIFYRIYSFNLCRFLQFFVMYLLRLCQQIGELSECKYYTSLPSTTILLEC